MTLPIDPTVPSVPATPEPTPAPPPTDAAISALAAQLNQLADAQANAAVVKKGVITASNPTFSPPDVSLTLSGDTTVINAVRYIDSYSPVVGDTVLLIMQSATMFVLGQMNDTTVTGDAKNGWTPFPTLGSGFTSAGGSALYRLIQENGDRKIECRGAINISGTPTAVCTMPTEARPAATRTVLCATSSLPGTLFFNSSGAVTFQPTTVGGAITGTSSASSGPVSSGADTQSTVSHSHGGAVALTTITHDDGVHSHNVDHSHTAGSFTSPGSTAPTFFSLEGIEFYL